MRLSLVVGASILALPVISSQICASDNDCYPEVFEPTNEWQVVREGQHIPKGLHVRMNMDTNEREAKLLDPNETDGAELVAVDNQEEAHEETRKQIEEALAKFKEQVKTYKRSKVNEGELNDFGSAVAEIMNFDDDLGRAEEALNTLSELAHDREFGVRLTQKPDIFEKIHTIALEVNEPRIKETCYGILGASLSNNPEAVTNVLQNQPSLFVDTLFGVLRQKDTTDRIQKRVLGVLQGLTSDAKFVQQRIGDIITVFPSLGQQAKDRVAVILEDLNLTEKASKADEMVSNYLQEWLSAAKSTSEFQFKQYFKTLAELHETGLLKPSKQFLLWLSEETEKRKADKDAKDVDFNKFMLDARHVIFGNPNAARKADEL
ncbi:hypothetical protein FDK38_003809 [Candidozyma auris]|nr:hypothetical protein FDK38_003809 [[Candida] auris]